MLRSTLQITEINRPLLSTLSNQFAPSFRAGFRGEGGDWNAELGRSYGLSHSSLSKSLTIPVQLAAAAGEAGMEVQLSVHQTE
jgi:hypothetical protein